MPQVNKVFVCSTAYDLMDVRAEVCDFVRSLGYEALFFEHSKFLAIPETDRHDQCVKRVDEADVFIVVIDKRYGAKYLGTLYPSENISVTWAETRRAIERSIPVVYFVRQKTWAERLLVRKARERGDEPAPGWVENLEVFRFLDYLQGSQQAVMFEFATSHDLKPKLGGWLDEIAGRVSHSLLSQFNSAFVSVEQIEPLLAALYTVHRGQVWLFNNDLDLIKSPALFESVYVKTLLPRLREGVVECVRIVLRPEKYLEFFDPRDSEKSRLLTNFSKMGDQVSKIHLARMDGIRPPIDLRLGTQNLVFYTVDGDPLHPDTVALVRQHSRPFMANPNGDLSREDLIIVCRELEIPAFFDRSQSSLGKLFTTCEHFSKLGIRVDATGKPQEFTLEMLP